MRKVPIVAALVGAYALLIGFVAVLVVALTTALADGWKLRQAADRHVDSSPRFSPDGRLIAFLRGAELWVMQDDGSDQRPVTSATRFAWTRRGDGLLVSRGSVRVFRVAADGGDALAAGTRELPSPSRLDRRGSRVVFVRDNRLWLRLADGSEQELT